MITLHNQYIKLCANIYIFISKNNDLFTDCTKSQPNTTKTCSNCKKQPLKLKNLYIFYRKINTKRKPKNKKSVFLYEKHTNTTTISPINTKKDGCQHNDIHLCGPTWAWTKDPLIMSQVLLTNWAIGPISIENNHEDTPKIASAKLQILFETTKSFQYF